MVVGGCRSSVAEHWRFKPQPSNSRRSSDSTGLDYLSLEHRSLDLGEPHLLGSLCLNVVLCHFTEEASNAVAHFIRSFYRGKLLTVSLYSNISCTHC